MLAWNSAAELATRLALRATTPTADPADTLAMVTLRARAFRMPGWAYVLAASMGAFFSIALIAAGHVTLGLLGLVGAVVYGVGFRRWDRRVVQRAAAPPADVRRFRWPRYSEHPLLNRLRWVAASASLIVFAVVLIISALR